MRAVDEGRLETTSHTFEAHIARCLGCRACEQVCPAGVEYGNLLESARSEILASKINRGLVDSLQSMVLRKIWLYPKRLAFLFFLARLFRTLRLPGLFLLLGVRRFFPRMAFSLALLEGSAHVSLDIVGQEAVPGETNKVPTKTRGAALFKGCVGSGLFRRVNEATMRVLNANGRKVTTPEDQGCCGALHAHSGDLDGARILAKRNIDAFAREEIPIVTNAGGCGAMLSGYGHLLAEDAVYAERAKAFAGRVRDIGQELSTDVISAPDCRGSGAITYDSSCHLLYGQKGAGDSLQMLTSTGVNFVPLSGSEKCCGGAGIYNLLQPELSSKVLRDKIASIKDTGAEMVATGNPGCHMQIRAGSRLFGDGDIKVCHPVEILDEAYRCAGRYE